MEYGSLSFDEAIWQVFEMKAGVFLLQAEETISVDQIHRTTRAIVDVLGPDLVDIVPAYDTIALFSPSSWNDIREKLKRSPDINLSFEAASKKIEIPICYELGLDLEQISKHTGLSTDAVITHHLAGTYRSIFIGFTPGFIYADGLDGALTCRRRTTPRKQIEAGSVGIGGTQTGIYSLNSPGGWNILGRTPMKLFDPAADAPMAVEVGTSFKFKRITRKEFETWGN